MGFIENLVLFAAVKKMQIDQELTKVRLVPFFDSVYIQVGQNIQREATSNYELLLKYKLAVCNSLQERVILH